MSNHLMISIVSIATVAGITSVVQAASPGPNDIRETVSALKESGKSLERTIAAKPTADFDEKWGQWVTTPDAFTATVYQGV